MSATAALVHTALAGNALAGATSGDDALVGGGPYSCTFGDACVVEPTLTLVRAEGVEGCIIAPIANAEAISYRGKGIDARGKEPLADVSNGLAELSKSLKARPPSGSCASSTIALRQASRAA